MNVTAEASGQPLDEAAISRRLAPPKTMIHVADADAPSSGVQLEECGEKRHGIGPAGDRDQDRLPRRQQAMGGDRSGDGVEEPIFHSPEGSSDAPRYASLDPCRERQPVA
jgi:hypothetical protein